MIVTYWDLVRQVISRIDLWITHKSRNYLSLRKTFFVAGVFLMFIVGYCLRSWPPQHFYLQLSPYEAFELQGGENVNQGGARHFTDQIAEYPMKFWFGYVFNAVLGNFYIIYFIGFFALLFLGWELSGKLIGGVLTAALFAVAPENFLYYTRNIIVNDSGLCYVFIFLSLLFLVKYLKNKNILCIFLFIISALVSLTSYHTGAAALVAIIGGLVVSLVWFKLADRLAFLVISFIFAFYLLWLIYVDSSEVVLIRNAFINSGITHVFFILSGIFFVGLVAFLTIKTSSKLGRYVKSEYLFLALLAPAAFLIFFQQPVFDGLLKLGVKNYYISTVTLNNSFAQVILTHFYILFLLYHFYFSKKNVNSSIILGWLLGVVGIAATLSLEFYYGRILDYSFPLAYVAFAIYWTTHYKWRKTIVVGTLVLLIVSEFMIFRDPFTMRRYYEKAEVESAGKIIELDWPGLYMSDLRTAALFRYLGKNDVHFFQDKDLDYQRLFYRYDEIGAGITDTYIILSTSMKKILYSNSFETTPVTDNIFNYYDSHFAKVYDDGLMMVYNTNWPEIIKYRQDKTNDLP
ncbi:MAG: hypothetical protein PHW95_01735 [Patescibacteria group bacterium]|nr:hypothetical protein [Patescibacteria group bacterium]